MAVTATLTFTNQFEDDTTATVSLSNVRRNSFNVDTVIQNIQAANDAGTLKNLLSSKYGANWRGISKLKVQYVEREYLF